MVNFTTLQTFLAVVETGNLNKAAERLNVTQSTVTARLDALEAMLGQTFLIRSRRGAQLTRAGFAFRPHAELLVRGWAQARSAAGLPNGFSGLFSFACQFDVWHSAGAGWLDTVRGVHPQLAYEAWPGALTEIREWLASGQTDAAIVTEPLSGPGFTSRQMARERLVQVATVPRTACDWDPDYIFVDLGPDFRRQHSQAWPNDRKAAMTFASSAWALDHLMKAGGSAYLPWGLVEAHVAAERLYPVEGSREFARGLHLVWRDASLVGFPWIADDGFWGEAI